MKEEYLDRERVLESLWNLIWASKSYEAKSAHALAYCEIRNLGFDTPYTLKQKLK